MAKFFSLEGKGLKLDTAADIDKHIQPLKDSNDVEEVHFQGNTLGVEACEALAKVLESKKSLRVANFADIFTSRLLSEIPPALNSLLTSLLTLPALHTVNLSDNAFGLNTVEPLRPFLSQHTPLQHLILNNNGLGPAAGTFVAEALVKLAEKKAAARKEGKNVPDLETVICGRNRLETGSMAAWVKAYTANNGVRTVKMVQNGIRQEGISTLLQNGLSNCTKLEVLDLQDNTFTAMGAKALADVAGKWTTIKELGVGDCLLSARGGVMLAEALRKGENKKLEVLRLQYNEIDTKGLQALSTTAQTSALPSLRRVELNGNKFSEEDNALEELREVLDNRKEKEGTEDDDEEAWGIDELDDLEEESDDEGAEDEGEEEDEDDKAERVVKEADQAEGEAVAQDKDKGVDELADLMSKTELK
ncbi:Ran GAP Rna1 [Taxawa tesnikishii (nom. ined.)]|nr:Ran GAP Rna1 [Dothideales sp. JES 119]